MCKVAEIAKTLEALLVLKGRHICSPGIYPTATDVPTILG